MKKSVYKFEIYRDKKREFRWRLKAPNGRIIAESGEGYKRKGNAGKSVARMFEALNPTIEVHYKDLTK